MKSATNMHMNIPKCKVSTSSNARQSMVKTDYHTLLSMTNDNNTMSYSDVNTEEAFTIEVNSTAVSQRLHFYRGV